MLFLAHEDPDQDIKLYINSPGGVIYSGLAIYDTMQMIKSDVATFCMGMGASMGRCCWPAERREALRAPQCSVLIHQGSGGFRARCPTSRSPLASPRPVGQVHRDPGGASGQSSEGRRDINRTTT